MSDDPNDKPGSKKRFGWFRGKTSGPDDAENPASPKQDETGSETKPEDEIVAAPEIGPAPEGLSEPDLAPVLAEEPKKKRSFFSRLKSGLTRSSNSLSQGITGIFTKAKLDERTLEELEDLLR